MQENQDHLMDWTMDMAIAFSDMKNMPRIYLILNKQSFKFEKTQELKSEHFWKAMDNKVALIDIKGQQVYNHEKLEWESIKEESRADQTGKRAHKRSSRRDRSSKAKEDHKQASSRKARRSKSTK
jgi:hypothetical protein